jgi:hypothetical protein
MAACNSIGNFTLVLSVPLPLVLCGLFIFGFFRFYASTMPSLTLCYFFRTQACLFLLWTSSLLQLETQAETQDSEAWKQCFIVLAETQWTRVQRLSSENKGVSPYIPLQAGYRGGKKQGLTHIC